jgi:hypothetical protein
MTEEMFKAYLDMIVEKAFIKGAVWESYKVISMEEAIKEAQEEILELKYKR